MTAVLTSILLNLRLLDLDGSVVWGAVREFIAVPIHHARATGQSTTKLLPWLMMVLHQRFGIDANGAVDPVSGTQPSQADVR